MIAVSRYGLEKRCVTKGFVPSPFPSTLSRPVLREFDLGAGDIVQRAPGIDFEAPLFARSIPSFDRVPLF
jgi:hypothetical protein